MKIALPVILGILNSTKNVFLLVLQDTSEKEIHAKHAIILVNPAPHTNSVKLARMDFIFMIIMASNSVLINVPNTTIQTKIKSA